MLSIKLKKTAILSTLLTSLISTQLNAKAEITDFYQEKHRPQFHFTPQQQWMNDPNGLVYYQGEYHLFYQHNPYDNKWGPMHWGHAVSQDLIHWQHLPIALFPDKHGTIFSGSAVIDIQNTSGLGDSKNPPMVAMFTYHNHLKQNFERLDVQTQGLAYSLDNGRKWTKFDGNPVLQNPGIRDFRDPKITWYQPQQKWIMSLAANDHIRFYSSKNLTDWQFESQFGKGLGNHVGVWECPDLIKMPIEGSEQEKWVLIVSVNAGAPNGGPGTQYFIGDFDGTHFTLDQSLKHHWQNKNNQTNTKWLDYGTDNFAGVTWNTQASDNKSNDAPVFIGWMNNWIYAADIPTQGWKSAMTLPRTLSLHQQGDDLTLRAYPIQAIEKLREYQKAKQWQEQSVEQSLTLSDNLSDGRFDLELEVDLQKAKQVELKFYNNKNEQVSLNIDKAAMQYQLDRSQSGDVSFTDAFKRLQTAPMQAHLQKVNLRVLVDAGSIEVFINHGKTVFTAVVFPASAYTHISLKTDDAIQIAKGQLYPLRSIWSQAKPVF